LAAPPAGNPPLGRQSMIKRPGSLPAASGHHPSSRALMVIVVSLALTMAAILAPDTSAQQQPSILETGVKAYQLGELVEAYKILKRALAEAQSEEDQATAQIYLAMVYMAWDQKELATGSITQAAQLDPGRKLLSADFPPEIIEIFEAAKPVGKGIIIVRASPEGAQVSIDGRPSGMADGSPIEVIPGRYQVSISKKGYWTQTRMVEVQERASEALVVNLAKVVDPLVIRHSPAPYIHERRPLQVSTTVTGGTPPFTVTLYLRSSGEEEYLASSIPHKADGEYTTTVTPATRAGGFVEYYIIAQDSAGSVSRNADPYDPYKIVVLPRDNQSPGVSHTPSTEVSAMEPLTLKFIISDQSAMESVKLFYMRGDDADYTLRLLLPLDDRGLYSVTIPGQLLEAEEIFYYLVATDTAGNFRSLGSGQAPFVVKPVHEPVSRETEVMKREIIEGLVSKNVTIGAGVSKGYKKGDTLFAINVVTRPTGQDLPPKITQELAGEIILTNVDRFSSQGEVVHEHYRGAVIPGSLIRSRPSPPRGVVAIGDKFEAVRVSWAPSLEPEVKGFIVFRSESLMGEYRVAARLEGRFKTELVDDGPSRYGLTGGTRYFYRVKAFNSSGALSDFSVTASDVVKGGPEPPTGLAGEGGQVRKIRITWTPNSDAKVAGYRIFRSKSVDGKYQLVYEIPNPMAEEYTDTPRPEDGHDFEEGISYWYKVLSYDSLGRTGELSEATEAASMEKPPAPGGLRIDSMTRDAIQLAWEPSQNPEIAGYVLYRSASLEGLFEPVAQINERWISSYVDLNSPSNRLRPDITYYYKLTVLNHAGAESNFSPPAIASMAKPLLPPSHLQASTGLDGIISLSWSSSGDQAVTGYRIYRGETPGSAKPIKTIHDRESESFDDIGEDGTGLNPGAVYYYSVRSMTAQGVESESAGWARGATKSPPPPPGDFTALINKERAVELRWTAMEDVELAGYRIYRSIDNGEFVELSVVTEAYFKDEGLFPGSSRAYKIQSIDLDGSSGPMSEAVFPETKKPPASPTGLFASPGMVSVALTWIPNREHDIKEYEIRGAREGQWRKLGVSSSDSWLVEDLAADTEYEFTVAAVDSEGRVGPPSLPVRVRTLK